MSLEVQVDKYNELKLRLGGLLKPGGQHKRNILLDSLYSSLPRDSCLGLCLTSPDRDHITSTLERPW